MDLGLFFFRYRSYIPIPFLLLLLAVEQPTSSSLALGVLIVLLGESIRIYSVGYAGLETRATADVGAPQLVTSGPYGITRNPIYVGNILIYLGFGIMSNVWWIPVLGFAWFLFQYTFIVKREEGFLSTTFGEAYREYTRNVPRFMPRLSPWKGKSTDQKLDLRMAIRSERRSFQSLGVTALLIVIVSFIKS
jgi:protein-S-isoprenylcysteine O-methyltransferase Ste14